MFACRKAAKGGVSIALWMTLPGLAALVCLAPPSMRPPPRSVHNNERLIQDMTGQVVKLSAERPTKVVVLSHAWPIYATLDAGADHIAGLSRQARQFTSGGLIEHVYPRITALPQTGAVPNVEQLMVWNPDAILTLKDASADVLKAISFPGLFQMTFEGAGWREPIINIWKALGRLDDREGRADAIIDHYEMASNASPATAVNSVPIRVIAIWSFGDAWSIGGRSYYLNEVFPLAGAVNIAANGVFASVNVEQVLLMDPDAIFLGYFGDRPGPGRLFAGPEWSVVRAVKDKRVYLMPIHSFYNWPIDIAILTAWMQDLLNPTLQHSTLRTALKETYRDIYDYELGDCEIDRTLILEENKASAGYARFRSN